MREIVFRGKRTDNGTWKYGSCAEQYGSTQIYLKDGVDEDGFDRYHVDPETVGQFTGLTDRNGAKIFEGDIVRWHDDTELSVSGQIAEVCFGKYKDADSAFDDIYPLGFYIRFSDKNCITICWLDEYKNCFDVVGNIYDNPELLEVNGSD